MNIWFVSAYDAPKGQSSRTYNFAKEIAKMGHNVTFITNGFSHFTREEYLHKDEQYRVESIDGITVLWLKTFSYKTNGLDRFINMLSNAYKSYKYSKVLDQKPDFVFGPSVPLTTALAAYFISKKRKAKFIFEIRDVWPQALIDLGHISNNSIIAYVLRKIEKYLYKKADHIVSALPYVHDHIHKCIGYSKDITYIPNGVLLEPYNYKPFGSQEKRGETAVTFVGSFAQTHATSSIIECAKRFHRQKIKVKFNLIGASYETAKLMSSELRKYTNIEIHPIIPKAEVPGILENSDILISSIKNTPVYQFGINSNKIYDYLGAGRPIVSATNAPNDPVEEAGAGIKVPAENVEALYDGICKILNMSVNERETLGKNGRIYAEKYLDVKILSKKLINTLERIS